MATIITLQASDLITNSRADINTSIANLNSDKIETSYLDTDTSLSNNSDTKIATQKAVKAYVDAGGTYSVTAKGVLPYIYPVGALYFATVSTNPTTLLGFGTWTAYGSGRVMIGAGTGTVVATFASRASNVITVTGLTNAANNEFQTGQAVVYHTSGNVITGLSNDTTYYVVRVSNLTFSLSTTLANAQNGTLITLSGDGTGTQTFTLTLTARTGGDTGGEENHAMSSTELLAHIHTQTDFTSASGSVLGSGVQERANTTSNTGSTGGNAAMNNMQPFISVYMWLRTV